jgi:O-antigen/teichoic acid export membrane protein
VLCVAVIALYEGIGSTGAVLAIVVSTSAALAVSTVATFRALRGRLPTVRLPEGALRFGTIQAVGGLFVVVSQRGPVVVVALITQSAAEAGFAALATGVTLALTFVVWQVFAVELPRLSALAEHAPADASASAARLATRATLLLIPVAALSVVAVDRVLPSLLGSGFEEAAPAFGPSLAVLPLVAVGALVGQVAALRLRPVARAASTGLGMLAFLAVAAIAVPRYDAVGGSLAFLAGTAAATVAGAVAFPHAVPARLVSTAVGGSAVVLAVAWASL